MDWKKLIEEIQLRGLSQAEIGKELGRSQAWVADVVRGRYDDLKWSDGQALIALHRRECKEKKAA
ncbi:MAG: hypothetical protein EG825_00300 [Rhodocyclaceae bacterium]|nr:hypothetical protein [Rhodocyclaceae bacterium]